MTGQSREAISRLNTSEERTQTKATTLRSLNLVVVEDNKVNCTVIEHQL
jgi:hypothetical protein